MKRKRISWSMQILRIENKGYAAFLAGVPESAYPYKDGYRNQNGAGGQLQQQRRDAWQRGWNLARREQKEQQLGDQEVVSTT